MEMTKIAVVGCGTMGRGIIQVAAASGYRVAAVDSFPKAVEGAQASVKKGLDKWAEKGKLTPEAAAAAWQALAFSGELGAAADADLVIEAIVERQDAKLALFRALDGLAKPEAVLASNTSSISITLLGAQVKRPGRVIGMHFMNPVPLMPLVEVIRGLATDGDTVAAVLETCKKMGKTPVEAHDSPGFVSNRVLMPMINEAVFCLYEGVGTAEAIDAVMKLGMNHPMGPLALADLIGLDVCLDILNVLHDGFKDPKYRPCPLLVKMVEGGFLGKKSGKGFYPYAG
jgi:3-hydroxybutyryl-CoA dehydrogenase